MKCPLEAQSLIEEILSLLNSNEILINSLQFTPGIIQFNEVSIPSNGKIHVIGLGKSSSYEVKTVKDHIKNSKVAIELGTCLSYTKKGHTVGDPEIIEFEGDHPLVSQKNIDTTNSFIDNLKAIHKNDSVVFLLSGGASALLELPRPELSFEKIKLIHDDLLKSGKSIVFMNEVRKAISLVKNGGLLKYIPTNYILQLINCDVPNEDMSSVGSAPLIYNKLNLTDINAYLKKYDLQVSALDCPKSMTKSLIYQSAGLLLNALKTTDPSRKLMGVVDTTCNEIVCQHANSLPNPGEMFISGGEATVTLPDNPGLGGRNTHYVLSLATEIYKDAGNRNVHILSFATDGNDGPTDCAGAYINYELFKKLDPNPFLQQFNSLSYMDQLNASIYTGPTGANVMDVRLVWREKS